MVIKRVTYGTLPEQTKGRSRKNYVPISSKTPPNSNLYYCDSISPCAVSSGEFYLEEIKESKHPCQIRKG